MRSRRTATPAAGILLLVALVAVAEADTDAADGNAVLAKTTPRSPARRSWFPEMYFSSYVCVIGALVVLACSCGLGESLQLLEQPGAAHRVVRQRRRPLRRRVDGCLLLWLRRHLNVCKEILGLTHTHIHTHTQQI